MHHGKCGNMYNFNDFYKNKHVFITGHTGFKGIWLCKMLEMAGAKVTGYSLTSPTEEGKKIFDKLGIAQKINSVIGDIRDYQLLKRNFDTCQPDIVIHLAAQPLVIDGYNDPASTYAINVMGTVNLLECIRNNNCVKSFLNVTTDKVYKNNEWIWGYRENDPLDGFDPYSNSKSCSELVTHSYKNSFFHDGNVAVSTARAGNVIGGGDFSANRIIPDCIRAASVQKEIIVRNPRSIRPYQHVLEPLYVYLEICKAQYEDNTKAGFYNIGPDDCDCVTTGKLADIFCQKWGNDAKWIDKSVDGPYEAKFLKLDCSKIKNQFKWQPRWHIDEAVEKTVDWEKIYEDSGNINACMEEQIKEFYKNR